MKLQEEMVIDIRLEKIINVLCGLGVFSYYSALFYDFKIDLFAVGNAGSLSKFLMNLSPSNSSLLLLKKQPKI